MNTVIISGYLTRDPEVRVSGTGAEQIKISRYTLGVKRPVSKEEQNSDFISCVAFKRQAEIAEQYLSQGRKVIIRGHLRTGNYTNKEGKKVYTTDVVIDEMEFADGKGARNSEASAPTSEPASDGFMSIPKDIEDDLPFK